MSIITDALKKAERDRGQKLRDKIEEVHAASVSEPVKAPQILEQEEALVENELAEAHTHFRTSSTAFQPKSPLFSWPQFSWRETNVFVLSGAFVVCFAALVVFLFVIFKWESTDQMTVASVSLPASSVAPVSKPVPGIKKATFPKRAPSASRTTLSYALTGISAFDNKHYAVVNGVVLKPGDSVDGAIVKDITDQEAVLETRAGELRLRIPV